MSAAGHEQGRSGNNLMGERSEMMAFHGRRKGFIGRHVPMGGPLSFGETHGIETGSERVGPYADHGKNGTKFRQKVARNSSSKQRRDRLRASKGEI